jgi:DNA polymerase III gamma/tau subunit
MQLSTQVHMRAPGMRSALATVEQAINFIDGELAPELARQARWTFARALLVEVLRTGKSRDMKAAVRQLRQALSNEHWLSDEK